VREEEGIEKAEQGMRITEQGMVAEHVVADYYCSLNK
jgi:hypothetical protein